MNRHIRQRVLEDLEKKIVFISGPRQSGKTTFSKSLCNSFDYINYDLSEHRQTILQKSWDRTKELVIFDELHKMKEWKRWLKGIYDTEGTTPRLLVTGSAKLDVFRKAGDSMAGRFFSHRLYPLDCKEIHTLYPHETPENILDLLLKTSGFPEPYLSGKESYYKRWRKTYLDTILKQDLIDLTDIRHISDIETLVELLKHRVGTPISISALAQELQYHHQTIKNWLTVLENLYVIFKVTPYHRNINRSLLKSAKYYFYDTAYPEGEGAKLENVVALALLKELHFIEDSTGADVGLFYLRTKDGQEVDFLAKKDHDDYLIEVKTSDSNFSTPLEFFKKYFKEPKLIQVVKNCKKTKTYPNGAIIKPLAPWLATLEL
ncbi:MAG: ATP-binding protein [Candidatus Margulisbacteria bacterium]|nr:ATP-binding protein [Candidatus Margulisiibacteriota bacterium]